MRRIFRMRGRAEDIARDVQGELAFHLEMRTRELEAAGMSHDDAVRAAQEAFGDVASIEAKCERELRALEDERRRRDVLRNVGQDIRHALRATRQSWGV